jgi:hypothetical protein
MCGRAAYPFPYTDRASVGAPLCPGVMEAYVAGVSGGTSPSTFSPDNTVTRVQMTTFVQRSLDQGLGRTRGALGTHGDLVRTAGRVAMPRSVILV